MKLACSTWMMPGDSFPVQIRNAANYGFSGVEIRLFDADATSSRLTEITTAIADVGIKPSSVLVPGDVFRMPLDSRAALEKKKDHAKRALDIAARLGCPTLLCPEYGSQNPLPLFDHPKRPSNEEYTLLMQYLSEAADYARNVGAIGLIEPINRYETHFYYSLEDGCKCLREVGSENLRLLADFFHMNLEEKDIAESICAAADWIYHVHLGDSNRMLPGQGHTDFVRGFTALNKGGYERYLALECSVQGDREKELRRCVSYVNECLKRAVDNED